MSLNKNNNTSRDYFPYEININKPISILGYNTITSMYALLRYPQELNKSKNRDIFLKKTNNPDNFNLNKYEEAKSLLTARSEVNCPLKNDNKNIIKNINNKSYYNSYYNNYDISSIDNNYNNTPIKVKRNKKESRKTINIFNYTSPFFNNNNVQSKSNNNNLINNHRNNCKKNNIIRNIKHSTYLKNKKSCDNIGKSKKNYDNSSLLLPHIYGANSLKNSIERKKNSYIINVSNTKKEKEKNINYSFDIIKKNDINDENDFIIAQILDEINSDNELEKNKVKNNYKKTLFINHINSFYKLYLLKIFNLFLSQIKYLIKNKKYHFENKSIKNISGLISKIKSNPFYYGSKRLSTSLLEEINIENNKNNNNKSDYYIKNKEIDINDLSKEKKRKRFLIKNKYGNNKNFKIINENKLKEENIYNVNDKKYKKRIIVQKNWNDKNEKEKEKKENIFLKDYKNHYIEFENDEEQKKIINRSYDKRKLMNNDNKDNIIIKRNNNVCDISTKNQQIIKKASAYDSFNKNIYCKYINKSQRGDKKNLKIYHSLNGENIDNSKYMNRDNNIKKVNHNKNNFIIDNNISYTMRGNTKEINNYLFENEDNENKPSSNNNFKYALKIITKIIENKEKAEKIKKLKKIIQQKIQLEAQWNQELIKKYFHILKNKKIIISSSIGNTFHWADLKQKNANKILFKKKLLKDKKDLNRTSDSRTYRENQSISMNGSDAKCGELPEKYHRKTLIYQMKKKRPIKIERKNISFLFSIPYPNKNIRIDKINYYNNKNKNINGTISFNNSLSINSEFNKKFNDIIMKTEKNTIINNNNNNKMNIRKSINKIGSFQIYKKNNDVLNIRNKETANKLSKLNRNSNNLNEKYQDYENLIYYLRIQLILYFISKKNNKEFYSD